MVERAASIWLGCPSCERRETGQSGGEEWGRLGKMAEAAGCQLSRQHIPVRRLASHPYRSLGHCIHLWSVGLAEKSAEGASKALEAASRSGRLADESQRLGCESKQCRFRGGRHEGESVGAVTRWALGGGDSLMRRCGPAGSVCARGREPGRLAAPYGGRGEPVWRWAARLENGGTRLLGQFALVVICQRWG